MPLRVRAFSSMSASSWPCRFLISSLTDTGADTGIVESVALVEGRVEVDSETVTVDEEEAFVKAGLVLYEGM